jgi:hypothetical protein
MALIFKMNLNENDKQPEKNLFLIKILIKTILLASLYSGSQSRYSKNRSLKWQIGSIV